MIIWKRHTPEPVSYCFVGSVSFFLPHPVAVSAFMICRGLRECTEMLWMCVLYVSFGSKVDPEPLGALQWVVHCC